MEYAKISGPNGETGAPMGINSCGEPLKLTDAAGHAIYAVSPAVADALRGSPITMAKGTVRVSLVRDVDLTRLTPSGEGARLWAASVSTAGLRVRAPDLPATWAQAIVAAA